MGFLVKKPPFSVYTVAQKDATTANMALHFLKIECILTVDKCIQNKAVKEVLRMKGVRRILSAALALLPGCGRKKTTIAMFS